MDEKSIKILEELKKEGLFLPSLSFNPAFTKKFLREISAERLEWFRSLPGHSLSEKIYLLTNNFSDLPVCIVCNKSVKFISYKEGYRKYCSSSCRGKGTTNQLETTCLQRYGVRRPAQSKAIQAKMKETSKKRHGVNNIFQKVDYIKERRKEKLGVEYSTQNEDVKNKIKETCRDRYGEDNPNKSKEVLNKRANTNKLKYGNICSIHGTEIWAKVSETKKTRFWDRVLNSDRLRKLTTPLFTISDYMGTIDNNGNPIEYAWKCNTCTTKFDDYLANGHIPRCPKCFPYSIQGTLEREVAEWLISILPNETIEFNTRRIISPLELDIYVPSKHLAIEFNEIFWHSEIASKGVRNKNYHLNKTKQCNNLGIDLIHIFENEWWDSPEIVKSIICSKLGIYQQKINARDCIIEEIDPNASRIFLDNNHLQGYAASSLRVGLFSQGELVAHLAIGKNRYKENSYEIVRYSIKKNCSVRGGLSKLWKYSRKKLLEKIKVFSYVDLRYFQGKSNAKIGFKYSHINPPGFYYTRDYRTLENRLRYQKHKLPKLLSIFDPNLTEWENMQLNGYDRIWDCGTSVWVLTE